jgi:hypothetical protein
MSGLRVIGGLIFFLAIHATCFGLENGGNRTLPDGPEARLRIVVQPANIRVRDGQPASFSVVATGKFPLTYQWKQGTTAIPGATDSTLSILQTIYTYNNAATYSVTVSDASGSKVASRTATLTIVPNPPVITEEPLSQTVDPNSTASFAAAAHGTLPLSYQWALNGVPISGATAPLYTTGPNTSAQGNQDVYTVAVTNGAGQTITSDAATVTVASRDPTVTVDCSEDDKDVAHHVNYRRGIVESFDVGDSQRPPSTIIGNVKSDMQAAGINFLNATLNINSPDDEDLFTYTAPDDLTVSTSGNVPLEETFDLLRREAPSLASHAVVQVSGTPKAYASHLDPDYERACNAKGNFYPLPKPGASMQVAQRALEDWIKELSATMPDAIWIGTQEPSHTLGYLVSNDKDGCSDSSESQKSAAINKNIRRFITYWAPIAQYLHNHGLLSGGIQLNASDTAYYASSATQIISAHMPLDYYTVQDYKPSLKVNQAIYSTYEMFQQSPDYLGVKVILDRYAPKLPEKSYDKAKGMISFLEDEAQLLPYADMIYGYNIETAGIEDGPTLLPQVVKWLQEAPAPLRPLTSTTSDLQAFALVQKDSPAGAYVAIWNISRTSAVDKASIVLDGFDSSLDASNLTVLKGSGNTISPVNKADISFNGNTISGLSLKPDEFMLISIRAKY